jgi:hypothetical protein
MDFDDLMVRVYLTGQFSGNRRQNKRSVLQKLTFCASLNGYFFDLECNSKILKKSHMKK